MRPTTLDDVDRLLDGLAADMHAARGHVIAAEAMIAQVRRSVRVARLLPGALPSDDLIADLVRAQAASVYAQNWTEADLIVRQRIAQLTRWPLWARALWWVAVRWWR